MSRQAPPHDGGLTIRGAVRDDAGKLAQFNMAMAEETERRRLDAATVLAGVRHLFDDPESGFYLVAEMDGEVVGSLMVTSEWSDWRDGRFLWIQSVYVVPERRRHGVFRALFDAVRQRAAARADVCGLRLYVEHDNRRAQAVYEAMGMNATGYRLYEVEV